MKWGITLKNIGNSSEIIERHFSYNCKNCLPYDYTQFIRQSWVLKTVGRLNHTVISLMQADLKTVITLTNVECADDFF